MEKSSYTDGAPIAAIATGRAESALSIVRTSGEGSIALLSKYFSRPNALLNAAGNTVVHGWITDGDRRIDEALVSIYRAPVSYTGEEGADITCHGGSAAPEAVLRTLLKAGFRTALRGEFTFRAFVNGKLDLSRAESVLEMVNAKTDKALANAADNLRGALFTEIDGIKSALKAVLSNIELLLDYSDMDGIEDAPAGLPMKSEALSALSRIKKLLASYEAARIYARGALAVIAGAPNVGKSSIFNMLLKEERAIVSPIPGTTRDYIEAELDIRGIPLRLVDTAGLRESADIVEEEGVRRSRRLLDEARLTLFVVDGSSEVTIGTDNHKDDGKTLVIWNKIDTEASRAAYQALPSKTGVVPLSALNGEGLSALLDAVESALKGDANEEALSIGTERQKTLLERAYASIEEALSLEEALDLAANALRDAVDALGMLTGEVTTNDILDVMFSSFCVGK